jgi:hypothetical protein
MMSELALLPSGRAIRRWDLLATAYILLCAAFGVAAGLHLWALAELHRGLLEASNALDLTARAIALLGEVPVVGSGADQLAGSVRDTAGQVRASALGARTDVRVLAVVVGAAVALLPVIPVLAVYLPLRLARRREVRGLRRALARDADPLLVEHLARAALRRVPFARLRRISAQPWLDVDEGRHAPLAAAELRRLGLTPPAGWDRAEPDRG